MKQVESSQGLTIENDQNLESCNSSKQCCLTMSEFGFLSLIIISMYPKIVKAKFRSLIRIGYSSSSLYAPTFFLRHPFFQSLYNVYEPLHHCHFHREKVYFNDGGHVALDWNEKIDPNLAPPILFIVHGITGGSDSNYIRVLTMEAEKHGFQCVVLNQRGINSEMSSHLPFTGFSFCDLQACLKKVQRQYPHSQLYLLGTSFGGNYLIRYLSCSAQSHKNIKALVALAPPFDIKKVVDNMGPIYQKFFTKRYIEETVLKHPQMKHWEEIGVINFETIKKVSTLREYHHHLTAKIMGLAHCDEVFEELSIKSGSIKELGVDTLLIASEDDPIVSFECIPQKQIEENPRITFIRTEKGGHLCWYEGLRPRRWYPKPIMNYLLSKVSARATRED